MKTPPDESGFFPTITQDFADQAAAQAAADRREAVARHIESMNCCWEEWDGNQGIKVGTRIELDSGRAELAEDYEWMVGVGGSNKKGMTVYAYMAPAFVVEVLDAETFIVQIDYPKGTDNDDHRVHVEWMNGAKLKIDILTVWPPVRLLSLARREE